MKNSVGKVFITVGLLSLIHSAYSAAQHRSYLRLTEQGFHYLPLDIIVQTVISLLVTIWGVTFIAGDFKEIRATTELESKSFEAIGNRPSFYTFSHRGRVLSSVYSQDRSYLRLTEQGFHYLPLDIIVQTVISLLVTIWGVTFIAGDFKEIRATTELESKSFEAIGNRPSFYTFSHRGRVLSSVYSQGHF